MLAADFSLTTRLEMHTECVYETVALWSLEYICA